MYYGDVTWASPCLKSPETQMFVQRFVLASIKENIKSRLTGPFWEKSTGDQGIPLTKG